MYKLNTFFPHPKCQIHADIMKMVNVLHGGAVLKVPVIVLLSCRNIKKANSNYTHMVIIHQQFMFSPIKARY